VLDVMALQARFARRSPCPRPIIEIFTSDRSVWENAPHVHHQPWILFLHSDAADETRVDEQGP